MSSKKIVIMRQVMDEPDRKKIDEIAGKAGYTTEYYTSAKDALPSMEDAEIAYGDTPLMTKAGKNLKWFCTATAGINQYLSADAFANPDCVLTNSSGAYGVTIGEHLVMVTLMLLRRYPEYYGLVSDHTWKNNLPIKSICDSTIVIMGTGDLGTGYAKLVRAFSPSKVIGVNRSGHDAGEYYDEVVAMKDVDSVLPSADILVMCLPGTEDTTKALSRERIALLSKSSYVINVGRGNSVDQTALVDALNNGELAGAALDVMEVEPIPEGDPLWDAKNVIITPHVSGQYSLRKTREINVNMFCEDLENYFAGRPLNHAVDLKKGY